MTYNELSDFFDSIINMYSVEIHIKDFVGFIGLNHDLNKSLSRYLSHEDDYCLYLKSDRLLCKKCLAMTKKLMLQCSKQPNGFFGYCHGGIGEYVFPIISNDSVIGSINIGPVSLEPEKIEPLIKRSCRYSQLNASQALKYYERLPRFNKESIELIKPLIKLGAQFLALSYSLSKHSMAVTHVDHSSSNDSIFSKVVSYINSHYTGSCTVREIAEYCHCSQSHINHMIKKRVGTSVRKMINKLRIEEAKRLLISTDKSIGLIAEEIGFNEQNYFTKVFVEFTGTTPFKFRKNNQNI